MKTVQDIVNIANIRCIVIYNKHYEKIAMLTKHSIFAYYMTEMYNIDISVDELLELAVDSIDVINKTLCIFIA